MKRSKFSLSFYKLLSCDMGELIPAGLVEVLPGDTMQHATNILLRTQPLLAPVMHPVNVRVHHWFVPHRLVWENFEDFITGGPDGMDASAFPTKTFVGGVGNTVGTLADYLGCPLGYDGSISALPFRGYSLIFNEWYRDQDLQPELTVDTGDGADVTTNVLLQNACWEKDYFTSARPWEQKGPQVTIPIGGSAPISGPGGAGSAGFTPLDFDPTQALAGAGPVRADQALTARPLTNIETTGLSSGAHSDTTIGVDLTGMVADLSSASAQSVIALREAFALQRYEEARARYGSRYTEYLRYLGVRSSDARLQRPEYLGGGRQTIQFSEVLQTAEGTNPVGELRGHGIAAVRSNRYRRFFEEHGYVFTLLSVRPKTIYTTGLARTWNRRFKEDFWQAELQHIGQQEVLNKELDASHASPDGIFGYQDRYDEYRRTESLVAGEFRNSTLDFWHLAREFGSDPALNGDFVECVPTERVFPVPSEDVLYVMARHSIQARRMVAKTGRSFIF